MRVIYKALYTSMVTVLVPLALIKMAVRNITDKAGQRKAGPRSRVFERFGIIPRHEQRPIVFHAVSVGESLTAIKLIMRYQAVAPDIPVVMTCSTQSASKIIRERLGDRVTHYYLPYDQPLFIASFLRRLRPRTVVIVETELWPNLIEACHIRDVKLILLNARLSKKSFEGYRKFLPLVQPLLGYFSHVCCQTERDQKRFEALGLAPEKCVVTGNLKFDIDVDEAVLVSAKALKPQLLQDRQCWIAGSTHEGEEQRLLDAHKALLQKFPNLVLIIAPRRPQRTEEVCALASERNFKIVRRTDQREIAPEESVFLLDTIGELMVFYALSDVCLVGGSFGLTGGHNPLEPGMLSKPILSGRNVDNFKQIYQELSDIDAVKFVQTEDDIAEAVSRFIEDTTAAAAHGARARNYVERNRGASKKSLDLLLETSAD